eukprot:TRINITY_DN75955_c0_g1_i1.p1 TRINITY_DN75955_c0_g1~~TRINITY_DN75955_c0_g1_i1.p1  ORF type:complete len:310 (-),score=34.45 TRINITY_DN75955_c0_g1_i1:80-952(-)
MVQLGAFAPADGREDERCARNRFESPSSCSNLVFMSHPRGTNAQLASLKQSLLTMSVNEPSAHRSNRGGWHSEGHHRILDVTEDSLPGISYARQRIDAAVRAYLQVTHKDREAQIGFRMSWASVNKPGDWNVQHTHSSQSDGADAVLTGAFYVSCPDRNDCVLMISGLHDAVAQGSARLDRQTQFSTREGESAFHFQEGAVVVFPTLLEHYVPPYVSNSTSDYRVSLSFDAQVYFLHQTTHLRLDLRRTPYEEPNVQLESPGSHLDYSWRCFDGERLVEPTSSADRDVSV